MKHFLIIAVLVVVALIGVFWFTSDEAGYPPSATPVPQVVTNILVSQPRPNATVRSPVVVSGKARTFESTVNWRMRTTAGLELVSGFTTSTGADVGQYGDFSFAITAPAGTTGPVVIEVYEISAENGTEINKVSIPVTLK